jgi:hypothetical protein
MEKLKSVIVIAVYKHHYYLEDGEDKIINTDAIDDAFPDTIICDGGEFEKNEVMVAYDSAAVIADTWQKMMKC